MRRTGLAILVGLMMLGATVAAFAADATRPGGARRGEMRPGAQRPGLRPELRRDALELLRDTTEGKAEIERFQGVLKAIVADHRTLMETIKKEIDGGKKPEEAFTAHEAEIKALIKRRIDAAIEHRTKMLAIAKAHEDELVNLTIQDMKKWRDEHKGQAGDQQPPAPRGRRGAAQPESGGERPQNVPPPPAEDEGEM